MWTGIERIFRKRIKPMPIVSGKGEPLSLKFTDIFNKINTAGQIVTAAEAGIAEYSTDHVAATQELLAVAGAGVAAETSDTTIQAEAQAAATEASQFVPLVFQLLSLFKKKT